MRNQHLPFASSYNEQSIKDRVENIPWTAPSPPAGNKHISINIAVFRWDRLIEGGMVLSMALYYIVANPKITIAKFLHISFLSTLSHLNPLFSLLFFIIFAVLCFTLISLSMFMYLV